MTAKKSPTNADLAADIKELKGMVMPLVADVKSLKDWRRAEEIARSAVDKYKRTEAQERREAMQDTLRSRQLKVLRELSPLIAAAAVAFYAISQGIKP